MAQHASSLAGVAYDAATPLNEEVRGLMVRTSLADFLAARPSSGAPVVTLDVDDSVGHAMEVSSPRLHHRAASACSRVTG